MRSFRHWSPTYIVNRTADMLYQKRHPDAPWLTPTAIEILRNLLRRTDIGLEYGSGRSTVWLAKRISALTSVEHDHFWYEKVTDLLSRAGLTNTDRHLCPEKPEDGPGETSAYVQVVSRFAENSLDFVLVDGIHRAACANSAAARMRTGGILALDNCNWYLPSDSHSPGSRTPAEGPASEQWAAFVYTARNWRRIWTSNGVTDTVLYFKNS